MGDKDFRCSLISPSIQEQSFSIEGSRLLIVGFSAFPHKKCLEKTVIFWGGVFFFCRVKDQVFGAFFV